MPSCDFLANSGQGFRRCTITAHLERPAAPEQTYPLLSTPIFSLPPSTTTSFLPPSIPKLNPPSLVTHQTRYLYSPILIFPRCSSPTQFSSLVDFPVFPNCYSNSTYGKSRREERERVCVCIAYQLVFSLPEY